MTKPLTSRGLLADALGLDAAVLDRLLMLADRLKVDPNTGTLHIQNGAASLALQEDGEIRLSGTRIVQTSSQDITLDAAWIDLN